MANIVITHSAGIFYRGKYQTVAFYEGLVNSFRSKGHNVLHILTSNFLPMPWNGKNKPYSESIKESILKKIKTFNPDLVISLNNSSVEGIEKIVDCPIALWDADRFEFFNDKEFILKNQDRFCYLAFSNSGVQDYRKILSVNENSICRVPSATSCKNVKEDKKYDISFIGTTFFNSPNLLYFLEKYPEYCNMTTEEVENIEDFAKKIGEKYSIRKSELKYMHSGFNRASIICALFEFDIAIFGARDWLRLGLVSDKIFDAYDSRTVFSLEHNEKIYNRSSISLNVCHAQNTTGYPWRVLDIMASSSVLLSDYRAELEQDFPKIKLPVYSSKTEVVGLTKKLLMDSALREDLIFQSNDAIDSGFRWHHRFPLIAQVTGVDLIAKEKPGLYECYNPVGFSNIERFLCMQFISPLLRGNRIYVEKRRFFNYKKLFRQLFPRFYSLVVLCSQIRREALSRVDEYD